MSKSHSSSQAHMLRNSLFSDSKKSAASWLADGISAAIFFALWQALPDLKSASSAFLSSNGWPCLSILDSARLGHGLFLAPALLGAWLAGATFSTALRAGAALSLLFYSALRGLNLGAECSSFGLSFLHYGSLAACLLLILWTAPRQAPPRAGPSRLLLFSAAAVAAGAALASFWLAGPLPQHPGFLSRSVGLWVFADEQAQLIHRTATAAVFLFSCPILAAVWRVPFVPGVFAASLLLSSSLPVVHALPSIAGWSAVDSNPLLLASALFPILLGLALRLGGLRRH